MKYYQLTLLALFLIGLGVSLQSCSQPTKAKEPSGGKGVIIHLISSGLSLFLSYKAGAFSLLF